ncbi:uncharacterized protein LOC103830195 isoform X2 [Brassica rapa]|uniref:uncharacterized protein LOC103830195 isoform X2 n=1 Tax=Brassica campestris TaxID=3711 RepID=UPI0004F1B13B|nr:uncharacterized protein LOC103830195 isoform X2 [Brassica rapa]XP_018508708.1 uncharacterized protein LOC103830195 isoform X2 [Brassica rapa]
MDTPKGASSYDWLLKHWFSCLFCGCGYSNLHKVASLVQRIRFSAYGLSQDSVSCNFSPASLFLGNGEEEDDDDEENSVQQVLLEKAKSKPGSSSASDRRKCCSFHGIHVGTRQKFVVAAVVLVFILMISFAILIWIASGDNSADPSLLAEVYVDIFASTLLITGGGLCFYGMRLFFNLRKVRSEQVSSEMRKVSGLAGVSVVCFTVSSLIALLTHIPLFYHWNPNKLHGINALVLLIIYYFIGSTLPLAFVLWVLRELPPQNMVSRQEEQTRITYVNYDAVPRQPPQQWTSTTVSKNQVSKASPI